MQHESLEHLYVLRRAIARCSTITALVVLTTTIGLNQLVAARSGPAGQDGVEVLTRGPVHEAFAETITFDPEPGIVAPQSAAGRH